MIDPSMLAASIHPDVAREADDYLTFLKVHKRITNPWLTDDDSSQAIMFSLNTIDTCFHVTADEDTLDDIHWQSLPPPLPMLDVDLMPQLHDFDSLPVVTTTNYDLEGTDNSFVIGDVLDAPEVTAETT